MSYDLMVFEPGVAPKRHKDFLAWTARRTKWDEGHSYNDPAITSERLQAWFSGIVELFPPLNGPLAPEEAPEDEGASADYSIGRQFIYVCFAWSKAESAYRAVTVLAERHQVAFFNVSSCEEEVWLPKNGRLVLAHRKITRAFVERLKRLLRIKVHPEPDRD